MPMVRYVDSRIVRSWGGDSRHCSKVEAPSG